MKATVTRTNDRITRIRFEVACDKPEVQYATILNDMPDDKAKREWRRQRQDLKIKDGWATVTPWVK